MNPLRVLDCIHAGPSTGAQRTCGPCGGKVNLKVYQCRLHAETTEMQCRQCSSYQPGNRMTFNRQSVGGTP